LVVGVARVVAKEVKTADHMDGGPNRKSCDRNRKSRDLKGKTADQSGKSIAGSGDRKSRDLKGKTAGECGLRVQSPNQALREV